MRSDSTNPAKQRVTVALLMLAAIVTILQVQRAEAGDQGSGRAATSSIAGSIAADAQAASHAGKESRWN